VDSALLPSVDPRGLAHQPKSSLTSSFPTGTFFTHRPLPLLVNHLLRAQNLLLPRPDFPQPNVALVNRSIKTNFLTIRQDGKLNTVPLLSGLGLARETYEQITIIVHTLRPTLKRHQRSSTTIHQNYNAPTDSTLMFKPMGCLLDDGFCGAAAAGDCGADKIFRIGSRR
jgi:hypothetical protein